MGVAVINRRTVLAGGGDRGRAAAMGFGGYEFLRKPGPSHSPMPGGNKPNILVIVVDQMRAPQRFPNPQRLDALLPNVARLRHLVRVALHRIEYVYAVARSDDDWFVFASDRVFVHWGRAQRVQPGAPLPDMGHDAAGAGIPDLVVGQVASGTIWRHDT